VTEVAYYKKIFFYYIESHEITLSHKYELDLF